ncbi:YciC family protein [Buchnera aphidicola]|uniref:YciC family protein n=1 Tax=Buchnera aphidicola TaxID=9 RepID=UPI003463FEB3
MPMTVSELRHDTNCFFSKQIGSIFFISISITFISILVNMLIKPDMHIISIIENNKFMNFNSLLELINNMNLDEKHELLKYSIFKIVELLMSKTLLLGSMIALISHLSNNKKKSIIYSISSLFASLPSLFILNCMVTFITQLGFILFIIPGILLSILLSLAPIILSFKQYSFIDSIRLSINISWKNIKIIGPGVLFWISGKFILTAILSNIYFINHNVTFLVLNISTNILFSVLVIYLFRFYMIFLRS